MKVWNKRDPDVPKDAIYVGRPSKWGNPWAIGDLTREQVVDNYKRWILNHSLLLPDVKKELAGKDLVCWCAPLACHADVLMEIANEDAS